MSNPAIPLPFRPALSRLTSVNGPVNPIIASANSEAAEDAILELSDGSAFRGISFGAQGKSVAGECVFQTG
jgi:carbamoyl-phosphate synthase/aspartate carbamoyltransferase